MRVLQQAAPNISCLGLLKARTTKTDAGECLDVNGNLSGMLCVLSSACSISTGASNDNE